MVNTTGGSTNESAGRDLLDEAALYSRKSPESLETVVSFTPSQDRELCELRTKHFVEACDLELRRLRSELKHQTTDVQALATAIVEDDIEQLAALGIDAGSAWVDDVVQAIVTGGPGVVIEATGPFAVNHLDANGDIVLSESCMTADELTGLEIARVMRTLTDGHKHVRLMSLLKDSSRHPDDPPLTQTQQAQFIVQLVALMRHRRVVLDGDTPGIDYLLLRESNGLDDIPELIGLLAASGAGEIDIDADEATFFPRASFVDRLALESEQDRHEFLRRGIALIRSGYPTSHALDAATFLHPRNREILHFVVLDKRFKNQQRRRRVLTQAIDRTARDNHHNVFFDTSRASPQLIAYGVCALLRQAAQRYTKRTRLLDDWAAFDPQEYADRNFADIIPADRALIRFAADRLASSRFACNPAASAADIGAGPNLYPSIMLAPFVQTNGTLDLIEFADINRDYLRQTLGAAHLGVQWQKFESFMTGVSGDIFSGALERARQLARVEDGSIFSLPRDRYDLVTSFFVCESISISQRDFWRSIRSLANCVKPDGILIVAHMIGSRGYHAGTGTRFPAVNLTAECIQDAYREAGLRYEMFAIEDQHIAGIRTGYRGMAVVVAGHSDGQRETKVFSNKTSSGDVKR